MDGRWRETPPRAVWVMRGSPSGSAAPLPAWPGLLLAWKRTDPDPPTPAMWQGLVAFSRAGVVVELQWFYDSELRPVLEQPPTP